MELHEKVKRIVIRITEIKQKIIALQGQINQNNSGVQAKEAEIARKKKEKLDREIAAVVAAEIREKEYQRKLELHKKYK
jgi:hypothetical protein